MVALEDINNWLTEDDEIMSTMEDDPDMATEEEESTDVDEEANDRTQTLF